jgi:hypothetical protein
MSVVGKGKQDGNGMIIRPIALELLLAQLLEQRSDSCMGEAGASAV